MKTTLGIYSQQAAKCAISLLLKHARHKLLLNAKRVGADDNRSGSYFEMSTTD